MDYKLKKEIQQELGDFKEFRKLFAQFLKETQLNSGAQRIVQLYHEVASKLAPTSLERFCYKFYKYIMEMNK